MKFKCTTHGELDEVIVKGYSIGHSTERMTELDLEGLEFRVSASDSPMSVDDVSCDRERYMEKFADWEEQIVGAFDDGDAIDLGLICPECGGLTETVRLERMG